MMQSPGEIFGIWVAAGLTLIFFSFIYRDNVFFKFGEHLYLGISLGYYVNFYYWSNFVPDVYRNILVDHKYWVIVPSILGCLILLRVVPKLAWLSRTSFALYIGGAAGIAIPSVINSPLLPQLSATLKPFDFNSHAPGAPWNWPADLNQVVILVGVFTTLIFFFFSLEHRKTIGAVSKIGLFFIMVGFGASFGNTVMARISLLIGRFQFLIFDWLRDSVWNRIFHQ